MTQPVLNYLDVYLEPLNFIRDGQTIEGPETATAEPDYRNRQSQSIAPGSYGFIRFTIGIEGSVIGATSISFIKATISQPVDALIFFERAKSPYNNIELGLSVDHLDPQLLTQNQRRHAVDLLAKSFGVWWENATVEVKKLLGDGISSEDEAIDICRKAGIAYEDKHFEKAKELYNEAISKCFGIDGARFGLGEIAIDEGDLRMALKLFYDELQHANNPSKGVTLLYLYEINSALGFDTKPFTDLREFHEFREKFFLPSHTIAKIRKAAQGGIKQGSLSTNTRAWASSGASVEQKYQKVKKWWQFWK